MMDRFNHTTKGSAGNLTNLNLSYLDQADAFVVNEVVRDWPQSSNPFVVRIARATEVGGATHNLSLGTFMEVAGILTSRNPSLTYTFSALVEPTHDSEPNFTVALIEKVAGRQPPIMADNAGFFQYAMKWFASRSLTGGAITFSLTANALFWVH
jgi:hypothetical protein